MRSVGPAADFIAGLPDRGVHAVITDPPWDMMGAGHQAGSEGKWRLRTDPLGQRMKASLPYETQEPVALAADLACVKEKLVRGGALCVFLPGGDYFWGVIDQFKADGWKRGRLLIWDKAPFGGGGIGGFWRNAFEPIIVLTNGAPRALPPRGWYPSILRQRPRHTRTGKPWELYRVLVEASTVAGELVVDPFCGLGPLKEAAEKANGGPRRWLNNDVLSEAEVLAQAKRR